METKKNYNYTDDELCEKVNRDIQGKWYSHEEAWSRILATRKKKLEERERERRTKEGK